MGREEKPKCCSGCNTKCWRHYLKAVKVIYYFNGDRFVRAPQKDALSDLFLTAEGLESIMLKLMVIRSNPPKKHRFKEASRETNVQFLGNMEK